MVNRHSFCDRIDKSRLISRSIHPCGLDRVVRPGGNLVAFDRALGCEYSRISRTSTRPITSGRAAAVQGRVRGFRVPRFTKKRWPGTRGGFNRTIDFDRLARYDGADGGMRGREAVAAATCNPAVPPIMRRSLALWIPRVTFGTTCPPCAGFFVSWQRA
jgi:hypothetical protein